MTLSNWLERRRGYINTVTGETSLNYWDVLPRHLKLNQRYVHDKESQDSSYTWKWHQRMSDETLFQGVEVLPQPAPISDRDLPPRGTTGISDLLDAVRTSVQTHWRDGQFKVIFHSSGYDSRLLSAILKQLSIPTDDILFICTKIEGESFKHIMAFEGWPESCYTVYNDASPMDEYFSSCIEDFQGAWRRLGGIARLPANFFWYPIEGLQRQGLLPDDSQIDIWYTQYSDTVLSTLAGGGVQQFNNVWFVFRHHNIRFRPFKCAREFSPWLDMNVIRAAGGLDKRMVSARGLDAPRFKIKLCNEVMKGLGEFKNDHMWGDERIEISDRLSQVAHDAYSQSWYGQHIAPLNILPHDTQFSNYWEHWTSASLCDHLLDSGYDIT